MRTALRLAAGAFISAFLPCLTHAATENYQGLWWNPAESGWGLTIAHQRDAIMATWFTYDTAGRGAWRSMSATRAGDGTYSGTVYEHYGPAYDTWFDPNRVSRAALGHATLSFADADHGTLRYSIGGVEQAKEITRQVFGGLPTCTYELQPDLANATNYTDLWWAAHGNEPGWGISFAHQDDVIFATWFTYDDLGMPAWLAMAAPRVAKNVYAGDMVRTTGPAFGAVPFDPARVTRTPAGPATFTFSNGNLATFRYTMDGATRTKALTRELFAPPAGTRCRDKDGTVVQGRVFESAAVEAIVCADLNANGRCEASEPAAATDTSGAYTLVMEGGYNGPLVAEMAGYRMASPAADYSANVTPYTTLVQLTGEHDFAIAEMMVRNELGLPQRFAIRLDGVPLEGSLAKSIAGFVAAALKSANVGLYDPGALARVIAAFPPELTELPQLRIVTEGGAPIDSKDVYVKATFTLTNPASATPTRVLSGKIKGRGNFTWQQVKKPYKFQLDSDAAFAAMPDMLGMTRHRNFVLLADFLDLAVMRNALVFTLGNSGLFAEGLKWTPATVRVELWLNGRFDGLYTMSEDIRVDPVRLDISKMAAADVEGGYLTEVDFPLDCYNDGAVNLQHVTPHDVHVCIKTPDETAITAAQTRWIKNYIDAAETDLYVFNEVDRLNLVSYVDWYLVNEYIRNWDGPFYSSDYMWKDRSSSAVPGDRLLNMGPLWDFDISAGNANGTDLPEGCYISKTRDTIANWYTHLSGNRQFVDLAVARWKAKSALLGRLTDQTIAAFKRRLEGPATRNFDRWFVSAALTWPQAVTQLKGYLETRRHWMDQAFDTAAQYDFMCR